MQHFHLLAAHARYRSWKASRMVVVGISKVKDNIHGNKENVIMYGCVLHPCRDNLNCSERNLSGRIFVVYLQFSTTWAVSHSTPPLDH